MEKSNSQKIQLGIFVIIGTIVFLAAIYFVGNKQNMFGNTSNLKAVFANVNGLQPGNNVRYAGIDIGTVTEIEMINDTTININMLIDNKIMHHIQKNAVATISSDGLVGNMIVNIIPGKGVAKKVENGDVIQSYSRIGTDAYVVLQDHIADLGDRFIGSVGLRSKAKTISSDNCSGENFAVVSDLSV